MQKLLLEKLKATIKSMPCNSLKRVYPYQIQEWTETDVQACQNFIQELLDENLIEEKYDFQCDCGSDCTVYYRPLLKQGYQCEECEKQYDSDTIINKATVLYEIDKAAVIEYDEVSADYKSRIREFRSYQKHLKKQSEQVQKGEEQVEGVKVFLSYSHPDESYKIELDKHLAPLKRNGKIATWNDRKLQAGSRLNEEIKKQLQQSDIIILMVSADFLDSYYCYEIEMKRAIERAENGECKIVPIIVRPCMWEETPLKDFLLLPQDGKPINQYPNQDEAYLEIARGIKGLVCEN